MGSLSKSSKRPKAKKFRKSQEVLPAAFQNRSRASQGQEQLNKIKQIKSRMDIEPYNSNNSENYVFLSEVPEVCKTQPCVLGIDEAGRGPVLGPMVYGIAYCPAAWNDDLKKMGVDDSKALKEEQREELLDKIISAKENLGYAVHVLSPRFISTSMFKRVKYNLNTISHDTAIGLVNKAIEAGVRVAEVYVDTVGPPEKYQQKLEGIFPDLKITVAKKADSLYPCVSAASICAKVARDRAISQWKFAESCREDFSSEWGSGYPGDPVTKKFLRENLDPVFGFPSIVRFSWKTAETLLEEKGVRVEFEEEEPTEDPTVTANPSVKNYFQVAAKKTDKKGGSGGHVTKRSTFFRDRKLVRSTLKGLLNRS